MSNKRKFTTILAVAGATVLAAGGSAFVTNAGLTLIDTVEKGGQETEVAVNEKETELPLTVEKFAATKDSFTVKPQSDSEKKNQDKNETEKESQEETENSTQSQSGSSSGSSSSAGSSSSSGSSASNDFSSSQYYSADGKFYKEEEGGYYGDNGLYYDQWGGYYTPDGAYHDGQGGYWDGSGYHGNGSSSSGSSSSGSSSGGGNSYAYDDSYIMYDVNSRYVSEAELSSWSSENLAILRNEIFARHGRIFKTQKWIDYFATKTWYVPQYENVDSLLNDYEWANLDVILKLEAQRN